MLIKISTWLSNPKRKYKDGLAIFNALASDAQKKNFSAFFEKGKAQVTGQFDIKFTTLVNQVVFIQNRIKQDPEAFKQAIAKADKQPDHNVDTNKKVDSESQSNKTDIDSLPEELKPVRKRISEIIPLMAKLHAEMANEKLADDKRLPIIKELVALDDERRACWSKIDNYDPSDEEIQIEAKTIAMGADIQKRIDQLKENIARNEKSIEVNKKKNKTTLIDSAQKRLKKYRNELTELQLIVK